MNRPDETTALGVSLGAQIEEVEHELKMREQVYPHQVYLRKMRESVAEEHMRRLKAVLFTLKNLKLEREANQP